MTSNQAYVIDPHDEDNSHHGTHSRDKAKQTTLKSVLCTQTSGIVLFALGLVAGILIGYFAMNRGISEPCMTPAPCPQEKEDTEHTTHAPRTMPVSPTTPHAGIPSVPTCPTGPQPSKSSSSDNRGIFDPLTVEEIENVHTYMKNQGLITDSPRPSLTDNYIYGMALYAPYKQEALVYMDKGGPYPGRYADVHTHRGNRSNPDIMEYRVGPLGGVMTAQAMYQDGELDYNSRPRDGLEWYFQKEQVILAMAVLRPLLQESFDGAYFPDGGLMWHPQAPPGLMSTDRETRFTMYLTVDGVGRGRDLNPLPLTGTVHNPGTDTRTWYTHSFYYLNQGPFATAEDLLSAYRNGTLRKFSLPRGYRQRIFSTSFPKENSENRRPMSNITPPRAYNPSGKRFTIDDYTVKWMGWEFTIGLSQFRGISIYNAMFKGQRVMYENSLNDVTISYSTDASSQANTIYLDATFGMGEFQPLILGVDCPDHATLLEGTWFSGGPVSNKAICVFETAGEESLWRRQGLFAAGLPNHNLVVRYPTPLGNYDYTFDFKFFLDGSMKTETGASGFMQAAFWDPDNPNAGTDKETDPFGYRIGPYTHGALHDHSFGFKVDLDIGGTENSFELVNWKSGDVLDAFRSQSNIQQKPAYFLYNQTRYVEWETLTKESGLKIDMINPKFWTVVNEKEKNKWGVKKGYRIIPETTLAQVLTDSHPAMKAFSYTKYHCMVTKHNDTERFLSDTYALNRLANPLVSMDNYINDEPIKNKDIVTWLNIGFLHLPTAEDMPMTLGGRTSFLLKPFNYFDNTPTFDVPHYLDTKDHSLTDRPPRLKPCAETVKEDCYFCD